MIFCEVVDGQITRQNLNQPRAWGNTSFGTQASVDDYRAVGLWPVTGDAPLYDPATQVCTGPSYVVDTVAMQVVREYTITDRPISEVKEEKLEALAKYRKQRELAGTTVNGIPVATDEVSQAKLAGALLRVGRKPTTVINWKGEGGWVPLDATAIGVLSDGVGDYVQACFDTEKLHSDAINTLTTASEVIDYDFTTGWPA